MWVGKRKQNSIWKGWAGCQSRLLSRAQRCEQGHDPSPFSFRDCKDPICLGYPFLQPMTREVRLFWNPFGINTVLKLQVSQLKLNEVFTFQSCCQGLPLLFVHKKPWTIAPPLPSLSQKLFQRPLPYTGVLLPSWWIFSLPLMWKPLSIPTEGWNTALFHPLCRAILPPRGYRHRLTKRSPPDPKPTCSLVPVCSKWQPEGKRLEGSQQEQTSPRTA